MTRDDSGKTMRKKMIQLFEASSLSVLVLHWTNLQNGDLDFNTELGLNFDMSLSTTDRMFVDFLKKMEKIQKDLDTMGMFDEIANTQTISKLESMLPQVVMPN